MRQPAVAPPPAAVAPPPPGGRAHGAAPGAISHLILELFAGAGVASHALAHGSRDPSFKYSHTYETNPGCREILVRLLAVHLASGTPSDGFLGSVRFLLELGPESVEAVVREYILLRPGRCLRGWGSQKCIK